MVDKFHEKHGHPPLKIVVAPVALVALGLKKSVEPFWNGIPVECRLFDEKEVASKHTRSKVRYLGIFVKEDRGRMRLVACDLKGANSVPV
jgi:hypothetical protein